MRHYSGAQFKKINLDAPQIAVPRDNISNEFGGEQSKSVNSRGGYFRKPVVHSSNTGHPAEVPRVKPFQKMAEILLIAPSFSMSNRHAYLSSQHSR